MNDQSLIAISKVIVDLATNTIALHPAPGDQGTKDSGTDELGVLDIGIKGHLIGIELETQYFAVSAADGSNDALVRSSDVTVNVTRNRNGSVWSIVLPRLGSTYEITFPIGNQCWRQSVNGSTVESCVITVGR